MRQGRPPWSGRAHSSNSLFFFLIISVIWRAHGRVGRRSKRPDEVPAILQRGEMVLSRAQLAAMGAARDTRPPINVVMNITTPDANSFRYAQGQIAADAARAMDRARRNL